MRRFILAVLVCGSVSCGTLTGPKIPERSETAVDSIPPKDSTGSITLIICVDGVCPDGTVVGDSVGSG